MEVSDVNIRGIYGRGTILLAGLMAFAYSIVFGLVFYQVFQNEDLALFQVLNGLASSQGTVYLAIVLNEFGDEILIIILAGLAYLMSKRDKLETASLMISILIVSDLALWILKSAYFRPRPSATYLPLGPETDSSFPSGHTTRAFSIATTILLKKGRRNWPLLLLAIGTGLARVVVGVHYPLDVLGGALLGLVMGLLFFEPGNRLFHYLVSRFFPARSIG